MFYDLTIPQLTKTLGNLEKILVKSQSYADTKKFDMSVLLQSRLAPDQFNLTRQIQIACDTAKLGVSRLTTLDAPSHDDNEKTLDELRQRIQAVIAYLGTFSAIDFEGAAGRQITTSRWEGKWMTGDDFLINHLLPNFYFHVTTAYSILRHNGVEIGKKDYLGEMPFRN